MLETNWIELNVAADGTVTWRESANVYQFSNETVGVRIYTPFDPHSESALINIRLPDDTVLQEKAMTYAGYDTVEGVVVHKWQYLFGDLVTALTGYDYAASIVLAFRALDASNGQSKTTNQISVPIQPSIQGESLYVDPDTADVMNAKIDKNSGDIEDLNKTVGDIFDAAVSAKEYAEQAAGSAQQAEESAQQASGSAEEAVSVSKRADERSSQALDIADGVKANLDQAVEDSANAVQVANEAITKSANAEDVANKVREDFDQIAESELSIVQEKGQGTAVAMSQKAVTDALLETVEVSELSGEILTIPNTAEGALEDYRILGKSVQHISPNLFDVEKAKVLENWVNEDSFYYFDIMLKANTQYNFNCKENNGYGSNFNLAIISGDSSAISICNNGIEGANVTKRNFTTPSDGNVRLRLLFNTSDTLENLFANIVPQSQINEGTTALPYEPYTGTPAPDNPIEIQSVESPVNVVSCGTNLLNNIVTTSTINGVTFTVNADKSVTVNGTATNKTNFYLFDSNNGNNCLPFKIGHPYSLRTTNILSRLDFQLIIYFYNKDGTYKIANTYNGYNFTLSKEYTRYAAWISVDSGTTIENITIYPQINEGSEVLSYEPYCGATTEITVTGTDGTVYPLRGIGDIHDEVDFDRNALIQRVGEYVWSGEGVFGQQSAYDSDLTTVFFSSYLHANQNCKAITDNVERSAVLFDRFPIDMSIYTAKDSQGAFISSNVTFRINKSIANTANDFKAWLAENPVTVVYPLAEPVEIPLQTLPAIPTMDGTTTITTTNTPAPELYCTEYMDAQMGNPVTLKSLNEVINPVTSAELVYNRNTKNTVARDITELQMKNTDQDKQIDTLNEKLYSTDPTKVIPVKKAETANVVPLKYLLDTIYPVGSIYISTVDNSPMNFLGGTWTKLTGDAYLKIVTSGAGNYGGTSSEHKIPIESVPSHSHTYTKTNLNSEETHYMSVGSGTSYAANEDVTTGSAGGGQAYYPYYYGVYVWQRVPD